MPSLVPYRSAPSALVCLALTAAAVMPLAASAQAQPAAAQDYDIAAGPLGSVLNQIARAGGLTLTTDAQLVTGRQAAAVQGRFSAQEALRRALQGSGLELRSTDAGTYTLAPAKQQDAATAAASAEDYSLREVRVSARRTGDTEGSQSYTSDAITLGKTAQSLREMPQSVSVLTRQRLEDQNITDLGKAAEQAVGLTVRDASFRVPAYYSRGFQIDSLQLDGGAPMDIAMYGNLVPDMAQYDRVELLRGAAGLLNGTGNPGGAINLVRKMPTRTPQFHYTATAGRWDNYRSEIDASGPLAFDGRLRGRAVVAYEDRKYFQDHRATTKPFFYGVLEADLNPDAVLSLGYREGRFREKGGPDGLPRYSNGADLRLPRHVSLTQDWAYWNGESKELFAKLSWRLADRWTLRVNATEARQQGFQKSAFTYGSVDPITLQGPQWSGSPQQYRDQQRMLDVNLSGAFDLLGRTHEVLVGMDMQDIESRWQGNRGHVNTPAADVFNPDAVHWAEPVTDRWMRDYSPDAKKQYGVYGTLRMELADPLKLIVGARANKYKYHQEYRWTLSLQDFSWDNPWSLASATRYTEPVKVTPFAGLVYDFDPQWSAYASYAQIFQPQADKKAGPMPGSRLDPMRGSNMELGLKGELLDGRLNTNLALYRIVQDHRAVADRRFPSESVMYAGSCCYLQQGRVVSQGLDVEVSGQVARGLNLYAGYTYNSNRDATENAAFSTITPKHLLKFWGTWQLPAAASAWKLGGGATVQSRQYASGTASSWNPDQQDWSGPSLPFAYTQPGYAVWNMMAEYRLDPNWTVALNVNNVLDKTYYRTVGSADGGNFYGEPRNWMLTLRGKF